MNLVATFGYAATGAVYLLLTVLLLTTWQGRRIGAYLILACILSVAWGAILAIQATYSVIHPFVIAGVETLRTFVWILFLARLGEKIGVSRRFRYISMAVPVFVMVGIILLTIEGMRVPGQIVDLGDVVIPGSLLMALLGLVLIEQLYRNSPDDARWPIKPLVIGVGGIFAYDLFLYSQGLLLSAIDLTTWSARGVVNLLFVPLIAIATRRNTDWELRIFVSRQVIFYSTTLTVVGLYLLLMSLGGYLILVYGGSWGALARAVFFTGAGIVLFTLLFSETLRARLKVFLNKHFYQNRYDHREEWLRLVSTIADFDFRSAREVAIKAVAQVVNSPAGAMWMRDDRKSDFRLVSQYQTDADLPDISSNEEIVRFIENRGWLVDFVELSIYPQRYDDLKVPEFLKVDDQAWLLVPLRMPDELIGLILLCRPSKPRELNYEDRDLLKTVGNHIATHLAQARSDNLLAEAQQFEAYNRLTAFLMHDLSNLIAQQSLLVENAEQHKRNPDFVDDAISTIAGSVDRMRRIIKQLKVGGSNSVSGLTDLKFVVSGAVDRCSSRQPVPSLDLGETDVRISADVEEFTMVLVHLLSNAQDACGQDGSVKVCVREEKARATIEITDNGLGMSAEFIRERLFKPFDSTKGAQGMGIGAYQAREFVRRIGGELNVRSSVGSGTSILITIPIGTG